MEHEYEYRAVARMQEYIGEHLQEQITLKQLARAAGYSPWHCARLFKELTGKAPLDYVRTLRLSKAALVLRDGNVKIVDTAIDFVFDSHEGFTRAFSREFGLSPKKYSMSTPPIKLFMPTEIMQHYRYLSKIRNSSNETSIKETSNKEPSNNETSNNETSNYNNKNSSEIICEKNIDNMKGNKNMSDKNESKTIFVQVVERPARKLLLKRGINAADYFEYCEEVGCDVWPLLCSVKEAIYEPVGLWLPEYLVKDGTSAYVQGVEVPVDYSNTIPEGYELIDLPPSKMMIFQSEPYNDDDFMEEIGNVWEKIAKFDPTIYGYKWADDVAPRFQLEPLGYRGYIEGRPVSELNK